MRERLHSLVRAHEFYLALIIIVVCLVVQFRSGEFFTANNIVDLIGALIVPGIFAIGVYMALVSGGIDVSFPALASLAVYAVTSTLVEQEYAGTILLPFLLVVILGAILGSFNGLLASRLAVPVLIITLGTASIFQGIMQGVLGSVQIPILPPGMDAFGDSALFETVDPVSGRTSSMPMSVLFLVGLVIIAGFIMKYTYFGRGIYAIGGDEIAARRVGFRPKVIKFWLYVIVGIIAAIAGLARTTAMGTMHPTNLLGTEILVIAAVVLGGTAITGGKGTLTGALLGSFLIVVVQNSMILMGIPTFWQRAALGILIVVGTGVGAMQVVRRRKQQRLITP